VADIVEKLGVADAFVSDSILLLFCGGLGDDGMQLAPAQFIYDFSLDDHIPAEYGSRDGGCLVRHFVQNCEHLPKIYCCL
jgi:hypothetical protein